jgi:hypothetical protein
MLYVKAALAATLAALVTLIIAVPFQVWLTGFMLERELQSKIDTRFAGAYAVGGDVDMLPAFVLALAAFLGVFAWRVRRQYQRHKRPA